MKRKQYKGFSLIELLVVVAIAGIMAAVALPSIRSFIADNQIFSKRNEIVQFLTNAKTAAVQHQLNVVVDVSGNEWFFYPETRECTKNNNCINNREAITFNSNRTNADETGLIVVPEPGRTQMHFDLNGLSGAAINFYVCLDGETSNAVNVAITQTGQINTSTQGLHFGSNSKIENRHCR